LFDKSAVSQGASVVLDHDWNGYVTNYTRFTNATPGGHDVILSSSPAYESGALGNWYLPTNSALVNAGSLTNAGLGGLFFFGTSASGLAETNSPLDISMHYAATSVDSDGDGPDYLEDINGN